MNENRFIGILIIIGYLGLLLFPFKDNISKKENIQWQYIVGTIIACIIVGIFLIVIIFILASLTSSIEVKFNKESYSNNDSVELIIIPIGLGTNIENVNYNGNTINSMSEKYNVKYVYINQTLLKDNLFPKVIEINYSYSIILLSRWHSSKRIFLPYFNSSSTPSLIPLLNNTSMVDSNLTLTTLATSASATIIN